MRQYRGHEYVLYRSQCVVSGLTTMPNPLQHAKFSKVTERNYGGLNLNDEQRARRAVLRAGNPTAIANLVPYMWPVHDR